MAEPPEMIMEEIETMLSLPKGGIAVQKVAHFIQPMLSSADPTPEKPLISLPLRPITHKINFNGWRNPTPQWISWVDRLHSSYKFIWIRAGIYDAILSSRYKIVKNEDLLFGVAERWCSETSTFVFPWGEATVSLEDVMVLGGYSVLGDSVSGFVGEREFAEIERKLANTYEEISRGKSLKPLQSLWLKHFMRGRSEIEHEAFLSLWLSRFVLPTYPYDTISKRFFKIAIHLARGTQIAVAPVVLASIYRDLSLLKSVIDSGTQVKTTGKDDPFDDLFVVTLWAPLQLVQVWAWERFPQFRPNPNDIEYGQPRLARWHFVNENEIGNVRPMLQSAGDSFEWRPYCKRVDNLPIPPFYGENEDCVLLGEDLGEGVQALARFLRVCELVGMDSIEQYNPHRVAMQFGFDQDVPQHVRRCLSLNPDMPKRDLMQLAWLSYTNPIKDETLYIPSKSYKPMVTMRYLTWHRRGVLINPASFPGVLRKKRTFKKSRRLDEIKVVVHTADHIEFDVPPGSSPRNDADHGHDLPFGLLTKYDGSASDVPPGFSPMRDADHGHDSPFGSLTKNDGNASDVPPGFSPKSNADHVHDLSIGLGNDSDVPPGFSPRSNVDHGHDLLFDFLNKNPGNDSDVPPGFLNNLKEECADFESKVDSNSLLKFGNQNVHTCFVIELNEDRSVKMEPGTESCEIGGKDRANLVTPSTLAHDIEEEIEQMPRDDRLSNLEARIMDLERILLKLKERRSGKSFSLAKAT